MNERRVLGNEPAWRSPPSHPSGGTHLRSGDAVSTGSRPLLPEEQNELRARSARYLLTSAALLSPLPFLFLGFLAVLASFSAADGSLQPAGIAVMLLMLATVPALLLQGRHCWRRGIGFRNDARQGLVYRFERAGGSEPGAQDWFEVLPSSKLVWSSANPAASTVEASFREIADPSAFAATAAEWTSPLKDGPNIGIHVNLRELTAAERDEVRRHAWHTALRPLRIALPLSLWAGFVLYLAAREGRFPAGHQWGSFLLLCLATACADLMALSGIIQGLRLWQDQQIARVIIVRLPNEVDPGAPHTAELSPPREFLPFSRRRWTVAGNPSAWRVR